MAETTQERMVRYLQDAYGVEQGLINKLQDMADEVKDVEVARLFLEHRLQTQEQATRLEARIRAYGEEPSTGKGWMMQAAAKISDAIGSLHDKEDKTVQDLMQAFGTENFECAVYEAMEAYANAIGDTETAALAKLHKGQEAETAQKLWPHIARTSAAAVQAAVPA